MNSEQSSADVPLRRIKVVAERQVAYNSPDHLFPWGTLRDNSRNPLFNQKLYRLFPGRLEMVHNNPLRILDMGCSGGGFVSDCLQDGCIAVGLEGSDYSKKHKRAEWLTIPEFLFTCDITGNFDILAEVGGKEERMHFDVVTSWEVMEHIADSDIDRVAENVSRHLAPGGIWIMSIAPFKEVIGGVNLHQTVQQRSWWISKFRSLGFEQSDAHVGYFNTQFVRGPKYGAVGSFHLVLTRDPAKAPPIPREAPQKRLYDRWMGSKSQKILRRWLVGG